MSGTPFGVPHFFQRGVSMRKFFAVLLIAGCAMAGFAQEIAADFASGSWTYRGTRLYQDDARAPLAKANIKLPQRGEMTYEFNVRYEGGAEDGHAGFGFHLFVDKSFPRASWGSGKSYLLWINYDENPRDPKIPKGYSAQVYRSLSHTRMELVESVDLNHFAHLLTPDNLAAPLPIRVKMNGETGEVRVYDPTDPTYYFYFHVDKRDLPMSGAWVALRTNGMKASFGL